MQKHPSILGDPQFTRLADTGDQDGGRLVHLHDGVEVLRVRIADHPVALGHRDHFLGRALDREPGIRICGGDLAERREELAQLLLVFLQRPPVPRPQRILEQRIGVHRIAQAVSALLLGDAGARIADALRRAFDVVAPALEAQAALHSLHQGTQELGSRHQGQLRLTLGDPFADDIDRLLRAVAAGLGVDAPAWRSRHGPSQRGRRVRQPRQRQLRQPPRRVDAERYDRQSVEISKNRPFQAGIENRSFRRNFQQFQRRW